MNFIKFEQDFIRPNFYPDIQEFSGKINDASLAAFYGFSKKEQTIIDSMARPIHIHADDLHKKACGQSSSQNPRRWKTYKKKHHRN